ncbi:hypothetical protein FQN49_005479 [Arthroderma sp. PD_2]|nr:hypothetical protein FQN49_005479 [Arthroderma sp. PD_2]
MSFLKNLNDPQKKVTSEGQQPRRRGPKPDSKPAQTRRQELNRQAQRTHRERKEQYIRALEVEISRLREGYTNDVNGANLSIMQHRQALEELKEENRVLREALASHGINVEAELEKRKAATHTTPQGSSYGGSTSVSQSQTAPDVGGMNYLGTPETSISPGRSPGTTMSDVAQQHTAGSSNPYFGSPIPQPGAGSGLSSDGISGESTVVSNTPGVFDVDPQLGIDFVLHLEKPCNGHLEFLCRRAHDDDNQEAVSGHMLMATCPPGSVIATTERGQLYPTKTYDLPPANLNTLLNLSKQLVTDDEITPIMALQLLRNHEAYSYLTKEDVAHMMDDLAAKVRCYGFGAVLENFEFMDSLNSVLTNKMDSAFASHGRNSALISPPIEQTEIMNMYS